MTMAEVASAAGFGSTRRFNETFQALFQRPPRALRRRTPTVPEAGVTLRIRYRPPYDWESMLGFFEARAIPGVEVVENGRYLRTIEMRGSIGSIEIFHLPERQSLGVTIRFPNVKSLPFILARIRRQFDTGADIAIIEAHLTSDLLLRPLITQRRGLRAPGGWDGFELATRAILGQQISVAAARRLAGELVTLHGKPVPKEYIIHPGLTRVFPTAERLASAKSIGLRVPAARQQALKSVAQAIVDDPNLFNPFGTVEEIVERLKNIRGVGEWTAHYIALRAIREMDAFPSSDIGLLRGVASVEGQKPSAANLLRRAEAWRPWRAYAAQHLWAADLALGSTERQRGTKAPARLSTG
jgi:AraC family transcriptional regulator of adaptative response / DNA-3-methyladenine glycosylase II